MAGNVPGSAASTPTVTALLDAAQRMVQERGFNAFSYKNLAEEVGIRTASIHYHFPTKAHLGEALMSRYNDGLDAVLDELEHESTTALARLRGFIAIYRSTACRGAICLCGSMASDLGTLPDELHGNIQRYLDRSTRWVRTQIEAGLKADELAPISSPDELAVSLIAGLQGGLVLARAQDDTGPLDHVEKTFMMALRPIGVS